MENQEKKSKKSNWDAIDAIARESNAPDTVENLPLPRVAPSAEIVVPASVGEPIPFPDPPPHGGFRARMAAGSLSRQAALKELQATYNARLDYLEKQLGTAVQIGKAQLEVQANEYLRDLEAKHLEALAEIGIRNEDARARALIKLNDSTVVRLREVEQKDWPETMIRETIAKILSRQKQTSEKIMAELGGPSGA